MKKTRFRAYQLGEKGSSFSYSVDEHFTLIEGRYNEVNKANVLYEMACAGATRVSCLHITSVASQRLVFKVSVFLDTTKRVCF